MSDKSNLPKPLTGVQLLRLHQLNTATVVTVIVTSILTCFALWSAIAVRSAPLAMDIGSWSSTTAYPQTIASRNMVARQGYLYVIGGQNASRTSVSTVRMTRIRTDGSLDPWTNSTSLPRPLYLHSVSATDSYIYVVGGWDGSASDTNSVHLRREVLRAPLLSSGGLGPWEELANSFPRSIDLHDSVIVNNRLYVLGGWNGSDALSDVYFADLTDSGVGSWQQTTSLPKNLYRLSTTTINGYIYVLGGFDRTSAQASVYFAKVNSDGSLGTWQTTTSLPIARYYHQTVIHDGKLVLLGGRTDSDVLNDVYSTIPNSDGTLGAWTAEPSLPTPLYRFAAASVSLHGSDLVYVVAGLTTGDAYRSSVYHSAVPPSPTPTPQPPTPTPTPASGITAQIQNEPDYWVAPGELITYTIAYRHFGPKSLSNVLIQNPAPDNVTILEESITGGGILTGATTGTPGQVSWEIGTLNPNDVGTVSYQVERTIPPTPVVPRALSIALRGPTSATANESIVYTLVVTNNVPIMIESLVIRSVLPEGATYVSGSGGTENSGTLRWEVDSLAGESSLMMEFAVTAQHTIVFSNYSVRAANGSDAYGRAVVVTVVDNTPPPASGDGVFIENRGATVTWEVDGSAEGTSTNTVRNPGLEGVFLPFLSR